MNLYNPIAFAVKNINTDRMDQFYGHLELGIFITDDSGVIVYANRFFLHILGYSSNEILGRPLKNFLFEEETAELGFYDPEETGSYHRKRFVHKSGSVVSMHFKTHPFEASERGFSGLLGQVTSFHEKSPIEEIADRLNGSQDHSDTFNKSSDLVIVLDLDGNIIDVNKAAKKFFEGSEEGLYNSVYGFLHGGKPDKSNFTPLLELACKGQPQLFERSARVRGKRIPHEITLVKGYWSGEDALMCRARNLAHQYPDKYSLASQEHIFKVVTESSTDVVSLFNENQDLIYISPAISRLTGYTPEEMKRIGFHTTIHPDDEKRVAEVIAHSTATRQAHSRYKYRQRRKDGTYFWLEVNALRRYDADGNILQTIANLRDVHAQVESEQKLKSHERLLIETQKLAHLGSWEYNLVTGDFSLSQEFLDIAGLDIPQMNAWEGILKYIHKSHRKKVLAAWKDLLIKGKEFNVDFDVTRPDAKMISVNSMGYAERDSSGKVIAVRGAVIDITRRKQTEKNLTLLKNKAEAAALAKQQFLGNMSHELRTPMNAVLGLSNVLLLENPREDQKEKLEVLRFSAESLLHIIDDILDISALEENKLKLKPEPTELETQLKNVIHMFIPEANKKGIDLKLVTDWLPLRAVVDSSRLCQVLYNLLGNAVKFTDSGSVTLKVSAENVPGEKIPLHFEIIDTGIGISVQEMSSIFDRFYRSRFEDKYKYGGTGLGLSISKRILELMGSKLMVESKPGSGTTFRFVLLVNTVDSVAQPDLLNPEASGSTDLSKVRILVAEDNTINQFVLRKILAKWNIQPEITSNGKEAVDAFCAGSYDLVMLDLQMPVMDGIEAAREIRKRDKAIPIIAVTAAVLNENRKEVFEAGMNDFIGKPFKPEQLLEMIVKHLNESGR